MPSNIYTTLEGNAGNLDSFQFPNGSKGGLRWSWKVGSGLVLNNATEKLDENVFLSWKFEWDYDNETQKSFKGNISVAWKHLLDSDIKFPVELNNSGVWIHKRLGIASKCAFRTFRCSFGFQILEEGEKTKGLSKLESMFGESESNDVVLIVEGSKRLHVNKAVLSYHSEYFRSLFFSEFQEKSMQEIEIKDVKLEYFAGLLSLISNKPVMPNATTLFPILELADRFQMTSLFDYYILTIEDVKFESIFLMTYTYKLEELRKKCLSMIKFQEEVKSMEKTEEFDKMPSSAKIELLQLGMELP